MNKQRRTDIAKAIALIEQAKEILETAASDERDYYDNMPDAFQDGDRGQRADEVATALEEAASACDDIVSQAQDAMP